MTLHVQALAFRNQIMQRFYQLTMNVERDNYPHELLGPFQQSPLENYSVENHLPHLELFLSEYERFYQVYLWLVSPRSKQMYIELILYRMLGFPHVKLRTNTPQFHQAFQQTARYRSQATQLNKRNFRNQPLRIFRFPYLSQNWKYMGYSDSLAYTFVLDQYHLRDEDIEIAPQKGDVVYDLGGYLGDTMLKFAIQVGPTGHVHSFDFFPAHVEILNRNMNLNPTLADRINIHPYGVGEKTSNINQPMAAGSQVFAGASLLEFDLNQTPIPIVSLDERIEGGHIQPPNFIKMDIEGFEAEAFQGARKSIAKYKPDLAISIYHKPEDFFTLPELIKSICPSYRFYLNHYTIFDADTILYATIKE